MPSIFNLHDIAEFQVAKAWVTAGTSAQTSDAIVLGDEFDSCLIMVKIGTAATDNTIKLTGATSIGGSHSDLAGTSVAGHATKTTYLVDYVKSLFPEIKVVVTRGSSTTLEGVWVLKYPNKSRNADATTNHIHEFHLSPAAGTA